jgi:hypothetical protein
MRLPPLLTPALDSGSERVWCAGNMPKVALTLVMPAIVEGQVVMQMTAPRITEANRSR